MRSYWQSPKGGSNGAPSGEFRALEGTGNKTTLSVYYSAVRKKEILPFAATGLDLEGVMLNKASVKDKHYMISLICGI